MIWCMHKKRCMFICMYIKLWAKKDIKRIFHSLFFMYFDTLPFLRFLCLHIQHEMEYPQKKTFWTTNMEHVLWKWGKMLSDCFSFWMTGWILKPFCWIHNSNWIRTKRNQIMAITPSIWILTKKSLEQNFVDFFTNFLDSQKSLRHWFFVILIHVRLLQQLLNQHLSQHFPLSTFCPEYNFLLPSFSHHDYC